MRGTWHFGARRLHVMGTCRWCPSRADQETQECSESMLTDPLCQQFLSWARFPRLMWHWTGLQIDPVTSRSPCLSHLSVKEPGGEFSGLSLPWTSHKGGCDRPENFCQCRGEICGGGSVANFWGAQMCAEKARKLRRKISPQISPLEKQNLATSYHDQTQNFAISARNFATSRISISTTLSVWSLPSHNRIDLYYLTVAR